MLTWTLFLVVSANMIKGKTPEEIRKLFNIQNDFTPEEEAQIKKENVSSQQGRFPTFPPIHLYQNLPTRMHPYRNGPRTVRTFSSLLSSSVLDWASKDPILSCYCCHSECAVTANVLYDHHVATKTGKLLALGS